MTYQNQPEDIFALLHALSWRERVAAYLQVFGLGHCIWPVALLLIVLGEWAILQWIAAFVGLFLLYYTYIYARNWWQLPPQVHIIPGELQIRLTTDFLEAITQRGYSRRRWTAISKIVDLPNHLVIYVQAYRYLAIPKKYFTSPEQAQEFLARLTQLQAAALSGPMPSLDWEEFRRDFNLDQFSLIKHLQWKPNPQLSARIDTLGIDKDGTQSLPTIWGLIGQLIFPGFLALFLFFLKRSSSSDGLYTSFTLHYTLLMLAILFAFIFGMQLYTYLRYRKALARQTTLQRPNQLWFYQEGVGTITEDTLSFHFWKTLGSVEQDRDAIVLQEAPPFVYAIVPKSSFTSPEEEEVIRERMQQCYINAHETVQEAILAETANEAIVADLIDNPFRSPPTTPP
ncbi:YcxB family protein [Bremerella cremea]|uniref:YcxB family protein n=1 Tax=Bremerella cremea TaxID=1031537 RepID=UPI0013142706|nr:YcxB family protein [Bremerella cremea]